MSVFRRLSQTLQQHGTLTVLIVLNCTVFLLINIIGNLSHLDLLGFFGLPVGGSAFVSRFWTIFTYMFTHVNLAHIFWNMVLFYFSAQIFFTLFNERQLLYVYVMSGLCGAALVLLLGLLMPASFSSSILIGASAAVLGVGAVMAVYSPDYMVYLFGILEMPYKYFYLLTFGLSTVIDLSVNTGGKISHVGGAAFGLVFGMALKKGKDLSRAKLRLKKKPDLKVVSRHTDHHKETEARLSDEQRMNLLLDKISRSGYDSLTRSEKDELYRLSQKKS
ncbi:MAG TPA: rhomboid family intramembrane serine protease [Bacteroidia bacterium]|nr:rhomboid family intramembrane serine protease [Bacteroidia bacterium]